MSLKYSQKNKFNELVIVGLGTYVYRRVQNRSKKGTSSSAFDFDRSAFSEKMPYSPSLVFDEKSLPSSASSISSASPTYPSPQTKDPNENSTTVGRKPQTPPKLRVRNDTNHSVILPSIPKAIAEKNRPSKHFKSSWLNLISRSPEDSLYMVGSPPPAYDAASAGGSFVIPVPTDLPHEQMQATPKSPATRIPRAKPKTIVPKSLVIPTMDEPLPVKSPARSESFAPKELVIPNPPASTSSTVQSAPLTNSPRRDSGSDNLRPRLVNVIAPYTPTLPDELSIKVGDTIRLIQEYRDGWGFAQYVGKADAPKGVVPLVCLEERKRMVPIGHKRSNGSSVSGVNVKRGLVLQGYL